MKTTCYLLAGCLIFLSACTAKKATTSTKMSDEAIVSEIKRNYTEAHMQEGMSIWEISCNKCHKLFTPESRTIAEWEGILPRMNKRSKLDDTQSGKVRAYILTHAKMS